jgi:putative FmdB family regulatory protein
MPIYEYRCERCGRVTEALQRVSDPPLESCAHCGGPVKKLVSAPAFQFKGQGWYVTDYAKKGGASGAARSDSAAAGAAPAEAKRDGKEAADPGASPASKPDAAGGAKTSPAE